MELLVNTACKMSLKCGACGTSLDHEYVPELSLEDLVNKCICMIEKKRPVSCVKARQTNPGGFTNLSGPNTSQYHVILTGTGNHEHP